MKLFNQYNLLLLIGVNLVISFVFVEAGFFDQFNKNKNKQNKNDDSIKSQKSESFKQEERKPMSQHPRRPVNVDEAAKLAAELSSMDEPKVSDRRKRTKNFSNILAAAKQQRKLENERANQEEAEDNQSDEGDDRPAAIVHAYGNVKIHLTNTNHNSNHKNNNNNNNNDNNNNYSNSNNKNKDKIVNSRQDEDESSTDQQQQQQQQNESAGETKIRRPKPNIRRPSSGGSPIFVPASAKQPKHGYLSSKINTISDNKMMHAHFWKQGIKDAYHVTKDKVKELPSVMKDTSDFISALLKLDSRGRLLAMIKEVEDDIAFVRREFSTFSITWAPIIDKALSYIGPKDLATLKFNDKDDIDFRKDALISIIFGYEFMRLMMAWRENLMIGHQAYKEYLEQVLADLEKEKFEVKEDYMYQLETIHNYILLNCWQEIDTLSIESKMKLDYLMDFNDQREKNYESEYFRGIVVLQEIYEPTSNEFKEERDQVINSLIEYGSTNESFDDVEQYFDDFRNNLVSGSYSSNINEQEDTNEEEQTISDKTSSQQKGPNKFDWEVPKELIDFMNSIQGPLRYHMAVYQKSFLKDLKEAKVRTLNEMYGTDE